MNTVTFPGLGLEFHLNRVAFSFGDFHIYWYGVIIALGCVLAAVFCVKISGQIGIKGDDFLDMLFFVLPGGIIGARIYYILFNPGLYVKEGGLDLKACLNVHNGGLAIYGGVIAGTLIVFLVARHKKISFPALVDLCTYGLLIGQIAGRWGNFVNAEAHGGETDLPWRMGLETAQGYMEVHPTFLYESLWNLGCLILLVVILKKGLRRFDGMIFLLYLVCYGFGRGLIEGLRTDSLYFFSTALRVSQLLGFASCILALGLLLWKLKQHPDPADLYMHRIQPEEEAKEEHGEEI